MRCSLLLLEVGWRWGVYCYSWSLVEAQWRRRRQRQRLSRAHVIKTTRIFPRISRAATRLPLTIYTYCLAQVFLSQTADELCFTYCVTFRVFGEAGLSPFIYTCAPPPLPDSCKSPVEIKRPQPPPAAAVRKVTMRVRRSGSRNKCIPHCVLIFIYRLGSLA